MTHIHPTGRSAYYCRPWFHILLVLLGILTGTISMRHYDTHHYYMTAMSASPPPPAVSLGTIDTKNIHAHDISYETFLQLTGAALDQFPTEVTKTFAGQWASSLFTFGAPSSSSTVSGWQYYLCANMSGTTITNLFLAGRAVNDFTPGLTSFASASTAAYNATTQQIKFVDNTGVGGYDKMNRYLTAYASGMPAATAPTAPTCTNQTQVNTYNLSFSGITDFAGKNLYIGGFFLGDDILRLKSQTPNSPATSVTAIRYFLGYDKNADGNKIKILLCAVDNTGKNLLINTSSTPNTHYLILERSWPPGAN